MISDSWQIRDTTTTNKDDRVLLQVMTFSWDIGIDNLVIRQLHTSDFTVGRVGLTRRLSVDTDTDTLLLKAALESWGFGILLEGLATSAHNLVE
jgi:hypothetical protein